LGWSCPECTFQQSRPVSRKSSRNTGLRKRGGHLQARHFRCDQAINSGRFASRGQKITSLKAGLEQLASTSQKNVVSLLNSKDAKFTSFWINNQVFVKDASAQLVQSIAALSEVAEVRQEQILHIDDQSQPPAKSTNGALRRLRLTPLGPFPEETTDKESSSPPSTLELELLTSPEKQLQECKGMEGSLRQLCQPTDGNGTELTLWEQLQEEEELE
ncbi:hypothetical protein Ocin01_18167, partial [Orchesella cincta]